jgi:hypothetical protein
MNQHDGARAKENRRCGIKARELGGILMTDAESKMDVKE